MYQESIGESRRMESGYCLTLNKPQGTFTTRRRYHATTPSRKGNLSIPFASQRLSVTKLPPILNYDTAGERRFEELSDTCRRSNIKKVSNCFNGTRIFAFIVFAWYILWHACSRPPKFQTNFIIAISAVQRKNCNLTAFYRCYSSDLRS